ncbi:hypothetical protein ACIA8K_41190 [Catenuloplanes sp. NPDC051500]|uniref:hypothetical protein n=1 Tax=Catenuloplanes sp. NPDC051500 TaxID=3363959 RepID=UPI0037BB752C
MTIDAQWWQRQAGSGATGQSVVHLPGCRRHATVASWDLPRRAEIYVDRVPRDAVAVLVALRRLLGAEWPFSDLRNLLSSQPIHAVTGNPAKVHRILVAAPDLRSYLFYDSDVDGLMPIWPDA